MSQATSIEKEFQTLRIRRLLMSATMYSLCLIPLSLSVHSGRSPIWVVLVYASVAAVVNTGFYFAIRSGFSLRFKDPSLTMAQMAVAIPQVLFTQIWAGPTRGAYLFILFITMVFGCLKLRMRQLLIISLITDFLYALTLPLIYRVEGPRFDLLTEITIWASFSAFMPFLSILAGTISGLRRKLVTSNSQLQEVLQQMTELATQDELTGVYNRRYILEMLTHEKNRTDRGGGSFCVCLMDLDHFKKVNDTYGHQGGDTVLKTFAAAVGTTLRSTDLLARYGGEEFLLFLPNTSLELTQHCMNRIQTALESTQYEGLPPEFRITASAGIAQYYLKEDVMALIARSDKALYRAKRNGRNRVELASFDAAALA